jgi:lipopolysaccharide export system permease protein
VLVYDTSRGNFPVWYVAREAYTTRRFWSLRDVVRRDISRDGLTVRETYLPELPLDLEKDVDFFASTKAADEMTGGELMAQIRMLTSTGAKNIARSYQVDYHFRFALPLACLIFGLVSAPVSFRFSRGGTFVGVLVSIVIGFLYWNVMILSKVLGANGVLPPVIAAWMQNIIFGAVAAYLVWRTG